MANIHPLMFRKLLKVIGTLQIVAAVVYVLLVAYAAYGLWLYFSPR